MALHTRILLLVAALLMIAVVATAGILTWTTQRALMEQTEDHGRAIAELMAGSAGFAEQVPEDVEAVIGDQMLVGATLISHLVAVGEDAGMTPEEIVAMLEDVTDSTVADEVWVTDETGHAYIRTEQEIDFSFSPDPREQPQASTFWPLLTGEETAVVQEAQTREVDDGVFKYVGVGGVDQPRIVQIGTSADLLARLEEDLGPARLADGIVAGGGVNSIRILDHNFTTSAYSGPERDPAMDWTQVSSELRSQIIAGQTVTRRDGGVLEVAAPVFNAEGRVSGAVLVSLPTTRVQEALRDSLLEAVLVVAAVLAIGAAASLAIARWVSRPVAVLTATAATIEAGTCDLSPVEPIARRGDGLGQLARVFRTMALEVQAREARLRAQVQELRIEIDRTQEARQVAEIVETDYFQELQSKAQHLRNRSARRPTPQPGS